MRSLVVVPTFNEADNIESVIERLFDDTGTHDVDLLVVDDSSPDGTADRVRSLQENNERVHLMERPGRQGLGSAYVAGFEWGLARGYEALVEMDADLSHDPAEVPRLLDALADAELSIGSRYVPGGEVVNWGRVRRTLSAGGNLYARMWLGFGVRDATSGFRAYRSAILEPMDLGTVRAGGYAFQIEMARRVNRRRGRIVEIPIRFVDRTAGKSKMNRRIVIEAIALVTAWGIRDRILDPLARLAGRRKR